MTRKNKIVQGLEKQARKGNTKAKKLLEGVAKSDVAAAEEAKEALEDLDERER